MIIYEVEIKMVNERQSKKKYKQKRCENLIISFKIILTKKSMRSGDGMDRMFDFWHYFVEW